MTAIIEIPKNSYFKTEINKMTGRLKLDRLLGYKCPMDYGYFESTLAEDGDALDVFVFTPYPDPLPGLAEVEVVILGAILCEDQGVTDNKLIATVQACAFMNAEDLYPRLEHYLSNYKEGFKVLGRLDQNEAVKLYEEALIRCNGTGSGTAASYLDGPPKILPWP